MFKEGCRIEVFADELRRRGEENQRNAQSDSTTLSERSIIDIDNSTAKQIREPSLDPMDFKTFKKFSESLAWETEVWIADMPDHMIHLNGDKFLGPR